MKKRKKYKYVVIKVIKQIMKNIFPVCYYNFRKYLSYRCVSGLLEIIRIADNIDFPFHV